MKTKKTKPQYRLRNWKEYNQSLINRGSLTIWFDKEGLAAWKNRDRTGKKGHPQEYADTAILAMVTLQEIYHLPLRQTQGLVGSIIELLKVELPVPNYTTLSRRRKILEVTLPRQSRNEPMHMVVDSTGIKVFGEGEWKVRQHGYTKRRTWLKVHLGVNESTGEIVASVVTTNNYSDSQILPDMLDQVEDPISQVSGDGGYDTHNCYDAIKARGATAAIPPQSNARIWQHGNAKADPLIRDQNLRRIRQIGRKAWKEEVNYHRRSLGETAMFRLKSIFGDRVSARSFDGQAVQILTRCSILNRMTELGRPDSYKA